MSKWTVEDKRVEPCPMTGCWLWRGVTHKGYGVTTYNGICWYRAHRAFWVASGRDIPAGMVLDHICRQRECVNPDHLRAVTPRENSIRNSLGPTAVNYAKTRCPRCDGGYTKNRHGDRVCRPCSKVASALRFQRSLAARRRLKRVAAEVGQ